MILNAAWEKDNGRDYVMTASLAKLYSGEVSRRVVNEARADPRRLRIHGRVSGLANVSRSEDQRDRRGHERSATTGDRPLDGVVMRKILFGLLLTALAAAPALAALAVGATAPDFKTQASLGGKVFTFDLGAALAKGPVVLYFYPAAFSQGCTIEAHDFASHIGDYTKLGATVIGVSGDRHRQARQVLRFGVPQQVRRRLGRQPRHIQRVRCAREHTTGICIRTGPRTLSHRTARSSTPIPTSTRPNTSPTRWRHC